MSPAITPSSIKELQSYLKKLFTAFRERQELQKAGRSEQVGDVFVEAGARWALTSTWGGKPDGSRDFSIQNRIRASKWKDAFLLIVMHLVMSCDTARVRVCPICEKLFARIR